MDIEHIQQALRDEKFDGWLFYDFHRINPIAYQVLGLSREEMYTRRWFYYIPDQGTPFALISAVEPHVLQKLPGERLIYRTWPEMQIFLKMHLPADARIAMEYSPMSAIPSISYVDGGTIDLIRSFGIHIESSANLAQRFIAQLNEHQMASHREAARRLMIIKDQLFAELSADLQSGRELDEYQVQQRLISMMTLARLVIPEGEAPIVAVNANSGNPHYEPTNTKFSPIKRGDLILFDFWARLPHEGAVYADYTWMAFAGTREEIPAHQREIFEIVRDARDTAIAFVRERLAAGERVKGCEVDDAARNFISKTGCDDFFVHRTGHNISTILHGPGANLDNFETQDERILLPNTCNSIEPGIYLPDFGIRSEVDLLIHEHDAEVTGAPVQQEIVPLLS